MLQTDKNVVSLKNTFAKLRKFVNIIIVIVIMLGFIYLVYWQLMTNDEWGTFEETKEYFFPLANFFFPEDNTNDVYRNTAFCLFACALPVALLYIILDVIKDLMIKNYFAVKDIIEKKEMEKEKANELLQYEVIKYISICLSFDWESESNLSNDAKEKLNAGLYSKLKSTLLKANLKKAVWVNKTLAIKFENFKNFDSMFYLLLTLVANVKKHIEKDETIEMIPAITVDAYVEEEDFQTIEKNHFKVMSFNLRNKAISSSLFVKKYNFLKLKKYLGYSIGDYSDFSEGESCMELHVIHNDLNEVLNAINDKKN